MSENVLVLGSGGREHVLAWKLAQSCSVKHVYVAPGNAGTENGIKSSNVALNLKEFKDITDWCKENVISLVVVGPEDPLAAGVSDYLHAQGIPCFGPSSQAAQLESSKLFAKDFMIRHNIPTATFQSFTDDEAAMDYIKNCSNNSLVVKASGLAAGKGVIVASTKDEACQAVKCIMKDKQFGKAGDTVIIEEYLEGQEVSVLAFTDVVHVGLLPPVQDHKRLLEGDKGPNTGGMGAYCPYPKLSQEQIAKIKTCIIQKAVDGMRSEGVPFKGLLYAGLMLTDKGPKVLEFNCRFGDPEIQSILPLMTSDFYEVCKSCVDETLDKHIPVFDTSKKAVGIVVVSGGYPGSYKKGIEITGLQKIQEMGLLVFHAGTSQKDSKILTSGGRVLAVISVDTDFHRARNRALQGAALVQFENCFYRKDIGSHLCNSLSGMPELSYKDSGVDIDAGNSLVDAIKPLAKSTKRVGCDVSLGSFGGIFDLKAAGFKDPLLVSGTDGVGTKLKVANIVGKHDSVGIDLVAMCVNDVLAHGAEPLFFLDYYATGKLDVSLTTDVISGIAIGCQEAGCALIGGETAEMPGMYSRGDYDVAGFTVGAVERDMLLPKFQDIIDGDVIIGLPSSGIHSNGFSLVRKIVDRHDMKYDMPSPFKTGNSLGYDLLTPTKIYVKSVLPVMKLGLVKAFAHITGGGLTENIPRILPENLAVNLDAKLWNVPPVFGWLKEKGNITNKEMVRTFNCGIGGILIVGQSKVEEILKYIHKTDDKASVIGQVVHRNNSERVKIENIQTALDHYWKTVPGVMRKKNVAVLISGSGTNLQALIDHTQDISQNSAAEISLVISNKPDVFGLERARLAGITTEVVNHKDYKNREEFDEALHVRLVAHGIEVVCLAGFMRILTGGFVRKWNGRMLNIHPSLLPSFKGANAHKMVIESHVRISGCTVHFVAEEVDGGAILVQHSVPVYPGDTEDTLSERVKTVEHVAFPKALELVASEKAVLNESGVIEWF